MTEVCDKCRHSVTATGLSPLMWSGLHGHANCVPAHIKEGADVNQRSGKLRFSALITAAQSGSETTDWGDIYMRSAIDMTGIRFTSTEVKDTDKCVELLLRAGADVNASSNDGVTALLLLAEFGRSRSVTTLIEAGADVNARNNDGQTALINAANKGYDECVDILIRAGADVNLKHHLGMTALSLATMNGHQKCIKLLRDGASGTKVTRPAGTTASESETGAGVTIHIPHESVPLTTPGVNTATTSPATVKTTNRTTTSRRPAVSSQTRTCAGVVIVAVLVLILVVVLVVAFI